MKHRVFLLLFLLGSMSLRAQTTVVGAIEGEFNIGDLGAATYSIPIKVPKGIGDMQPSLALVYNSQAGNGIMGTGWSVTASSAITRTGNSIYHDGKVAAPEVSMTDRLSLDGSRLLRFGGTYGAANSRYRTEVESFKDITANGTLGNGPQSFTVTDQNGWTYLYGATADSRVFADGAGTPYKWLLSKVTDLNGNYISYEYFNSPGQEALIHYINYTANTNILSPTSRIVFDYETRPDPNFMYLAGAKITNSLRLQSIRIQEGIYTIRSYNLEYATDFYTHLVKVTERGNESVSPLEQLPPTDIQYHAAVNQYPVSQVAGAQDPDGEYIPGDFNGDGLLDFVKVKFDPIGRTTDSWELYRNDGSGFTMTKTGVANTGGTGSGTGIKIGVTDPYNPIPQSYSLANNFDYDGDGTDELFMYRMADQGNGNSVTWVNIIKFKNNGTSYTWLASIPLSNKAPFTGDFDGDGRTEILLLNTAKNVTNNNIMIGDRYGAPMTNAYMADFPTAFGGSTQLNGLTFDASYCSTNEAKIHVLDYNGDGKSDILAMWGAYGDVYSFDAGIDASNNPVVNQTAAFKFIYRNTNFPTLQHRVYPGDFNGDGATDLATWKSGNGWQIGYGMANGSFGDIRQLYGLPQLVDPAPDNTPSFAASPIFISDFNGDGKSDIYAGGSGSMGSVLYAKGNHTFETKNISFSVSSTPDKRGHYTIGDFNGDGNADLMTHRVFFPIQMITINPQEKKHLVKQITNGLGAATKIEYASIVNNPGVYGVGSGSYTYPYAGGALPLKVVSQVNTDNGINSTGNNITYTYTGLRYHFQGKGLLGFEQMGTVDASTSMINRKYFSLNTTYAFPYLSSAVTRQLVGINLVTLSQVSNTYDFYLYSGKRIFPYISETTSQDNTTGLVVKTTNNYTFPGALVPIGVTFSSHIGKPMSITVNKGNGMEVTTQSFTYPGYSNPSGTVNVPVYIYSKPSSITTTTTRQGEAAYTRKQQFSYNATTGLVETIVSDPSTSNAVTESFTYTNYGNVAGITTSAAGLTPRTEITGYDATQRFPVISYNADFPNVKKTSTYNPITLNLESTTFPDGLTVSNTFDGMGRVKTSADNNGMETSTVYGWASASPYAPASAAYYVQTNSNTAAPSYKFYDRLGRLTRTAYLGFNGTMIYEDVVYNNKGQIASASKPYFSGATPQWLNNTYDPRGRILTESRPEGNTTYSYALSGGLYSTTMTNAAGQVMKTHNDGSGRLKKAEDAGGALEYTYHSNGKVRLVTLNGNIVSETEYDAFDRQKKVSDPNYGSHEYTYNAYDEVLSHKDPHGHIYTYTYDQRGKTTTKTGPEGTYTYTYNTAIGPDCGKLVQVAAPGGATENFSHGVGDRVNYEERILGTETLKTQYLYDAAGRLSQTTYPNGVAVQYSYNSNDGTLEGAFTPVIAGTPMLFHIKSKDAAAHTTSINHYETGGWASIANTLQQYDNHGLLAEQKTLRADNALLRHQQYSFQASTGNLLQRKDVKYDLREDFSYDNVNRLTGVQGYAGSTPFPAFLTNYADNGNILQKTDAGTFGYDQANRVSEIDPFVNIPSATQDISYTPFNKVATIVEDAYKASFAYWPDAQRARMELHENGVLTKTKYYSSDFEKEVDAATGNIRELVYVYTPEGQIAGILERKNGTDQVYLVLTDHLGSVTQIMDPSGTIIEEKSFDAWGRSRHPQTWAALPPTGSSNGWDRGYTGHEHLPQFGIINMNGRLYDPLIGRMMGPDPLIQVPTYSQSYNRYSYVWNNPLKYTDPTGEYIGWDDLIAALIGGTINLVANWDNIGSFSQGTSYFLAGAGSGIATIYGGPMAGGAVLGLTNSAITQMYANNRVDPGQLLQSTVQGAVLSQLGASMSQNLSPMMTNAIGEIKSPVISNMLPQALSGAATGFTMSALTALGEGANMNDVLGAGVKGMLIGTGAGLAGGAIQGIMIARSMGRNPFTGKPLNPDIEPLPSADPQFVELNYDAKQARGALRNQRPVSANVKMTAEEMIDNLKDYAMKNKIDMTYKEVNTPAGTIKILEMNGTRY